MRVELHANAATGAFGGAPYGATILVRGAPKWGGAAMRTLPLEPSVELPRGPGNAVLCVCVCVPKQRHAESKGKEGEEERRRNAGRCLFKTRTQHHGMVGKNAPL